jgi:hypothetical protein
MENLVRRLVAALVVGSACSCAVAELAASNSLSATEQASRAFLSKLEERTVASGVTSVSAAREFLNDARTNHEVATAKLERSANQAGTASVAAVKEFEETALWLAAAEAEAAMAKLNSDPDFIATQRRLAWSTSLVERTSILAESKAKAVEVEVVMEQGGDKK